jgi:hypothetical protein
MRRQRFRAGAILVGDASARKIPDFSDRRSTLNERSASDVFLGLEGDDGALRQTHFGQREEEGKRRFRSLV